MSCKRVLLNWFYQVLWDIIGFFTRFYEFYWTLLDFIASLPCVSSFTQKMIRFHRFWLIDGFVLPCWTELKWIIFRKWRTCLVFLVLTRVSIYFDGILMVFYRFFLIGRHRGLAFTFQSVKQWRLERHEQTLNRGTRHKPSSTCGWFTKQQQQQQQ